MKICKKFLSLQLFFLGGSPYNTPAFYTIINYADFNLGIWYPMGGMHKIVEALSKIAQDLGVSIVTSEEVQKINIDKNKKTANIVSTLKKDYKADYVVVNADYAYAEMNLLEKDFQTYDENYWRKRTMSPSALIIYLGVNKKINNLEHHNLYFNDTWKESFDFIFKNPRWPSNPSYYIHMPSKTDPSMAPEEGESLMILVPVAPGLQDTEEIRNNLAEKIIKHLENLIGEDISNHVVVKRIFSHSNFASDYNAYKGTALGLAHTLGQTAIFRPKNKSKKVKNLFYVGQYTNPGIGVPITMLSSKIVTNLLTKNGL